MKMLKKSIMTICLSLIVFVGSGSGNLAIISKAEARDNGVLITETAEVNALDNKTFAKQSENSNYNQEVRPLLTIIDDDGAIAFDTYYRQFLEKGIPITSAIDPVHWVGKEGRLDWDTIEELHGMGCEFVIHDVNRWTDGYKDDEDKAVFFKKAQSEFLKHDLATGDIGIYPQGANWPGTVTFLQNYLRACGTTEATNDGKYYSTYPINEPLRIPRFPIVSNEKGKHVSLEKLKE